MKLFISGQDDCDRLAEVVGYLATCYRKVTKCVIFHAASLRSFCSGRSRCSRARIQDQSLPERGPIFTPMNKGAWVVSDS